MAEILIVDDDHHLRQGFQRLLDAEGYETRTAASAEEALNLMREKMPQCVVMDVRMPGMDGLEALKRMRALEGCPPVVIMTAYSTTETAIEATRLGAFDYMLKPFDIPQVLELLQRALAAGESQRRHEAQSAEEALGEEDDIRLVGHTPPMQELYKAIGRVAPTDALVLIRGESGTGKELVANAIWRYSPRSRRPFSVINCVAIPDTLLESELFGYERGAFTGAQHRRIGRIEQAAGGTIFLDEIGDMPPGIQAKLLRLLQEKQIQRLGGHDSIDVDVRIIAATNANLEHSKNSEQAGELDFTYYSAVRTVENALSKVKDEKGMKRVEKFLRQDICPDCGGSRLCAAARAPRLQGIPLDEACRMTLSDLVAWVSGVPAALPEEMRPMAQSICESFQTVAKRLMDLGLGYLALDRAAATLSTGERQRMQLARAVRNRTTGVLYVLDEPSIGLHPANITGLTGVMQDLIHDGNSVILVDHDTQILSEADWLIEMGPQAGAGGGQVIAQGSIPAIEANAASRIGPFLAGKAQCLRPQAPQSELFALGRIQLSTNAIHTVKPLDIEIPKGRLTVVTGVSGSGKTTLVLESLVPGLNAAIHGQKLPEHVRSIVPDGITQVKLIDAAPIGINVRSTVATYANVHDELRKKFAATPDARQAGYKAGDFSYNTGKLRCPVCDGTGSISLDVQFLPDVEIPCPECRGSRYAKEAGQIFYTSKSGTRYSLPQLMDMDVNTALTACADWPVVRQRLTVLQELGLGYLTLGEETPGLSGGEAQRLKLASEMGKAQSDSLFVFDEPTIGLHPADVQVLLGVFQTLIEHGATVIVIEHDLDVIRNADYIIDMGPGGGAQGGTVVAAGTPDVIRHTPASQTGKFI